MLYNLFKTFLKIGTFTLGGGYAMLPIIQKEVVDKKNWLTEQEFLDTIAVSNSLPGPLAVTCATFIGYKKAKLAGALSAVFGVVIPSFTIILFIAAFFSNLNGNTAVNNVFSGIRPAVAALIAIALIRLSKPIKKTSANMLVFIMCLVAILFLNINPMILILISGLIGFFFLRKEGANQ